MKFVEKVKFLLFPILFSFQLSSQTPSITPLFSFGSKGDSPGSFLRPISLAVDVQGNIFVVDQTAHRLQKFSPKGELLTFIGGYGWKPRQFQFPQKVFVYNSLDVFVADYENKRIERYDKDLNWVASYSSDPNRPVQLQFFFPRSLGVSIHGDIFVIDAEYNRVIKYNARFEPELSFGDFDWGKGRLVLPYSLSISNKDVVFVTDQSEKAVKVYDYFGNFIYSLAIPSFSKPAGIAIDDEGRIFVSDIGTHQIHLFNSDFSYVCSFGSFGDKLGSFNEPGDLAVLHHLLFVVDTNNHRVQVFQIKWDSKIAESSE